ncbi:hypothetical protein ACH5RR_026414 [Cinchona calisaya]|uniref:t-SNARE coiled-coil homology domain-containing protein n=1 Tax=Cinchona calisaya TaxID=153742 RepID=A0ABD2Z5P6_9GENT
MGINKDKTDGMVDSIGPNIKDVELKNGFDDVELDNKDDELTIEGDNITPGIKDVEVNTRLDRIEYVLTEVIMEADNALSTAMVSKDKLDSLVEENEMEVIMSYQRIFL